MLVFLMYRNDGAGLFDHELRDGDIVDVLPDSSEATLGDQEKKSYLVVHMPDVLDFNGVAVNFNYMKNHLKEEEYASDGFSVLRARKFWVNYAVKFTAAELEIIRDPDQTLGVVHDRFDAHSHIIRKN